MDLRDELYIDGAWVAPTSSETAEVIDSTTEEVIGIVHLASAADVDTAVQAARAAFEDWSQVSVSERTKFTSRIGEALGARMADIAQLIAHEVG